MGVSTRAGLWLANLALTCLVLVNGQGAARAAEAEKPPAATAPHSFSPSAVRLDHRTDGVNDPIGGYFHCVLTGTYDPKAWDKNLDTSLPLDASIKIGDERFPLEASQPELVQWSWAKRARCQKTIGTVSAAATGFLGVGYIFAKDAHDDSTRRVTDRQLNQLGLITLLPVVVDELRAVGPTRRYYTSAVIGTSLMSARNVRLKRDLQWLSEQKPAIADSHTLACTPFKPVAFKLKATDLAGIDTLQAKVVLDIAAYKDWCQSFSALQAKVWMAQAHYDPIAANFDADRRLAWRLYANAINNGGYEQQATTATVLHKIITLPLVAASDILGADESKYKLAGDRPSIEAEDAVTLPTLAGDYDLALPASDLETLTISLRTDMKAVQTAMSAYHPKPKTPADNNTTDDNNTVNLALIAYENSMLNAAAIDKYYYDVGGVVADIKAQNARCYLILDVNGGAAYLSDRSVGMLKTDGSTTPNPTPLCQLGGAVPAPAAKPAAAAAPAVKPET